MNLNHADDCARLAQNIRATLQPSGADQGEILRLPPDMIDRVEDIIKQTPEGLILKEWELMASGLRVLANRVTCLDIALTGNGNLLEERARGDILTKEFRRRLDPESLSLPNRLGITRQSLFEGNECDPSQVRTLLASIPLPTLYWNDERPLRPFRSSAEEPVTRQEPMLRVIVFLDQEPVASPQFLNEGVLYQLTVQLHGLQWPDNAVRLRVNLNTTCPPEVYSVSDFEMDRPTNIEGSEYEDKLTGQITFSSKQSGVLDDLVFTVHAAFQTEEGHSTEIPVIGHNELRIRVVDHLSWLPKWGNSPLDQHIVKLVETLIAECPGVEQELPDLFPMLDALSRVCAVYAQEANYKGRADVSEKEFQDRVLHDLRIRLVPFPLEYALYRIFVTPVSHCRASRNPELEAAFQYQQI